MAMWRARGFVTYPGGTGAVKLISADMLARSDLIYILSKFASF